MNGDDGISPQEVADYPYHLYPQVTHYLRNVSSEVRLELGSLTNRGGHVPALCFYHDSRKYNGQVSQDATRTPR